MKLAWDERDTLEALKAAYLSESNSSVRTRLQGLWMLRRGMSISEVALALDVHYRTAHRWVCWYKNGGLDVLLLSDYVHTNCLAKMSALWSM